MKTVRQLPVKAGNMIYTKSGGIHGIRNPAGNAQHLKFVAFLYHASERNARHGHPAFRQRVPGRPGTTPDYDRAIRCCAC